MNKLSLIFVPVILLASLLVGCSSIGSHQGQSSQSPASVSPVQQPQSANPGITSEPSPSQPAPQTSLKLQIIDPPDGTVTSESTITVRGQTEPNAVVNANDQVTVADSEGNFSVDVNLDAGFNLINVVASNNAGAEDIASITVTLTS